MTSGPARRSSAARAELVEVDRRRVADDHLAGPRAEHVLGQQVADARRHVDPLRPAGDEPLAPLVDAGAQPLARGHGQTAERVAVEVDPVAVREHEPLAEAGQRIGRVERGGLVARHSHSITARQQRDPGSRCSHMALVLDHDQLAGARSRARSPRAHPRRARRARAAAASRRAAAASPPRSARVPRQACRRGAAAPRCRTPRAACSSYRSSAPACDTTPSSRVWADAQVARWPPAEWPIATIRVPPAPAAPRSPPPRRRRSAASRRRRRAAGTRCSTPSSRGRRGRRELVLELEPVARAPEAAVDQHGDVVAARVQLAELGGMLPVAMPRRQASARPRRAARSPRRSARASPRSRRAGACSRPPRAGSRCP